MGGGVGGGVGGGGGQGGGGWKRRRYRNTRPVLLTDSRGKWAAIDKWATKEKFMAQFGEHEVSTRVAMYAGEMLKGADGVPSVKLSELMQHMDGSDAFDSVIYQKELPPSMWHEMQFEYSVPEILQEVTVDLSLALSGATQGQPFHAHGPAWLGLVAGRKQWVLAPPSESFAMEGQGLVCSESKGATGDLPAGSVVITQQAGEIVYVPNNWWHATCNLSPFTLGVGGHCMWGVCLCKLENTKAWCKNFGPQLFDCVRGDKQSVMQRAIKGIDGEPGESTTSELGFAAKSGDVETVEYLISSLGMKVADRDAAGKQPLHWACYGGSAPTVELLIKHGAKVHDTKTLPPLHIAASWGHEALFDVLVKHGAKVNYQCPDVDDRSALHLAAESGRLGFVKKLLANGADAELKDSGGKRPADLAAQYGNEHVVKCMGDVKSCVGDAVPEQASKSRLHRKDEQQAQQVSGGGESASAGAASGRPYSTSRQSGGCS